VKSRAVDQLYPEKHLPAEKPAGPQVIFDLDGTLHPGVLGLALLEELLATGVCPPEPVMETIQFVRSAPDVYAPAAAETAHHLYAQSLAEICVEQVQLAAATVWERERGAMFSYTADVLPLLRRTHSLLLLSGSPDEVVGLVANELGIATWRGMRLQTRRVGGVEHYTGEVTRAPGIPGTKSALLTELFPKGFDTEQSIAIGNSLADAAVLELTGHSIAFEPDPQFRELAHDNGWTIADRASVEFVLSDIADCHRHRQEQKHG
jgi:phosphoserine phosphatase